MSTIRQRAISSVQTATFNGTSQYAGDLQQAINQAVAHRVYSAYAVAKQCLHTAESIRRTQQSAQQFQ